MTPILRDEALPPSYSQHTRIALPKSEGPKGVLLNSKILRDTLLDAGIIGDEKEVFAEFLRHLESRYKWNKQRLINVVWIAGHVGHSAAKSVNFENSPSEILASLVYPPIDKNAFKNALLIAEVKDFPDEMRPDLLAALTPFIAERRFASDDDTITLLGCAIRKYAMNMDEPAFHDYAQWLKPAKTQTLHHRVELELVKGIFWRLAYEPLGQKGSFPDLEQTLENIAEDYLSPRLILKKNYASIALHAALALVVLQAIHHKQKEASRISQLVREMDLEWFSELLESELYNCKEIISEHDAELAHKVSQLLALFGD